MDCKCGCGRETGLAKRTDPRYGTVEGQPLNYVTGHHNTDRKLPADEKLVRRRESQRDWRSRHPESTRKFRLNKLGWTEEGIAAAKRLQGNRCAICWGEAVLVPDHKHGKPPVPRALLCRGCNAGLGCFKERPETLEEAAAYLRKFSGTA